VAVQLAAVAVSGELFWAQYPAACRELAQKHHACVRCAAQRVGASFTENDEAKERHVSTTDESDLEEQRTLVTGATSAVSTARHAPESHIDLETDTCGPCSDEEQVQGYAYAEQAKAAYPVSRRAGDARRDVATEGPQNRVMPPRRESDRLLERLRTLVHDSRRGGIDLAGHSHEIEHLKVELADVVKRTAATTTSGREARQ
jgi:hypothetical protein